jgi:flagellar biosynthesis repressor protein FlbT
MKNTFRITLKPNEKLYVNGAVLRVDRKVSVELMNDVQFLLESHVLQASEASTPLRQLYFILQVILMNPAGAEDSRDMFRRSLTMLLASLSNERMRFALKSVDRLVGEGQTYEALKQIRALYPLEAAIMSAESATADEDDESPDVAHDNDSEPLKETA